MNNCIFCSIIAGKEKGYVVFEDTDFLVFLDLYPLLLGHCLLIPKLHFATVQDLPENLMASCFSLIQKISFAVEKGMEAEGSFIAVNNKVSQSVPHLHVHIVPRRKRDGLKGFFWPRAKYSDEQQMREVAERIRKYILG